MISNDSLHKDMKSLLHGESNWIANCSNFSSLLFYALKDINWCGFYLLNEDELVLGPFQGPIACTRISFGKGVCGTAWKEMKTIVVPDVEKFPGHIACSSQTKSEIVVPVFADGKVIAVLDVDSDINDNFDELDVKYLEMLCGLLS